MGTDFIAIFQADLQPRREPARKTAAIAIQQVPDRPKIDDISDGKNSIDQSDGGIEHAIHQPCHRVHEVSDQRADQRNLANRIAEIVDCADGDADNAAHCATCHTEKPLLSRLLALGHTSGQATDQPAEQAITVAVQNLLDNANDATKKAIKVNQP